MNCRMVLKMTCRRRRNEIKNGKYELTEIDANELLKIVEQDKNKTMPKENDEVEGVGQDER